MTAYHARMGHAGARRSSLAGRILVTATTVAAAARQSAGKELQTAAAALVVSLLVEVHNVIPDFAGRWQRYNSCNPGRKQESGELLQRLSHQVLHRVSCWVESVPACTAWLEWRRERGPCMEGTGNTASVCLIGGLFLNETQEEMYEIEMLLEAWWGCCIQHMYTARTGLIFT